MWIVRALAVAIVVVVGGFLAGAPAGLVLPVALVVGLIALTPGMFRLGVLIASFVVLWGLLHLIRLVPSAAVVSAWIETHHSEETSSIGSSISKSLSDVRTGVSQALQPSTGDAQGDLAVKLDQLKAACDKKLLTGEECEKTRAQLIANFSGK